MSKAGRQRKYTVGEIDRMRRATRSILNAQWGKGQWQTDCEDRLRTYMLNGTSPQEIERAAEEAKREESNARAIAAERTAALKRAYYQRVFDELGFDKFREGPEVFDSATWTGRS